jgi:Cytochrome domain of cellobiose dehydrogenase
MANAKMVIMWPNSDGSVTLSQRTASGEVMPTPDNNPPRVATLVTTTMNTASGSNPQLVYTVSANSDTQQNVVWAFGTQNPGSTDPGATIQQHLDSGTYVLDLTKPISSSSNSSLPAAAKGHHQGFQLQYYQKLVIGHAILCSLGFLLFLPIGALLARYFRTFSSSWFQGHWIVQFAIGGTIILTGIAMGIGAVASAGAPHLNDVHKVHTYLHFLPPYSEPVTAMGCCAFHALPSAMRARSVYPLGEAQGSSWTTSAELHARCTGVDYHWPGILPSTNWIQDGMADGDRAAASVVRC